MSNLKSKLIRLGEQRPELRDHIRPVLNELETGKTASSARELKKDVSSAWRHLDELEVKLYELGPLGEREKYQIKRLRDRLKKTLSKLNRQYDIDRWDV